MPPWMRLPLQSLTVRAPFSTSCARAARSLHPPHPPRSRAVRHAIYHHHHHNNNTCTKRAASPPRRRFSHSPCRCRAAFAPRHGKAVEPEVAPALGADKVRKEQASEAVVVGVDEAKQKTTAAATEATVIPAQATLSTTLSATPSGPPPQNSVAAVAPAPSAGAVREAKTDAKMSGPMQAVLYMGSPSNGRQRRAPPGYVHHFDSHTLVKHLQAGGYTLVQAITAMKAIRGLLARNLDVAQGTLVSKIDAENESYLFRAACSELAAEVKNNRRSADEDMRQQRILLQHEVDILTQTLNQELLTLTDNVRGMFNDRRMTVREEQRSTEANIQQLTYQISIQLSSDAKSEIESLRWILIRRSVLGIIFMAVLTLGTLRYATYLSHERQKEQDRKKKEKEQRWRHDGMKDQSSAPDAAVILAAS